MKKILFLVLALAQTLVLPAQTNSVYSNVDIPFQKFKLDNGLTLIVHEDHALPIASFNIWYHVGSKNELPGKTGFAHLFEHIMFTSTEHWGNFDEVLQTVGGGNNNGTTNNDRTNYFETFTSTGLDRVLWLEADRMGFLLNGLDSNKVDIQRGVVQNEKRQGDNQPYAIAEELTVKATYPVGHPYSWTVIGSMEDLAAASIDDVKNWFRTYYGPNNAVVAIAGDVNAAEVLAKVKKYFDDIPPSPPISKYTSHIAKMHGHIYQVAQDLVPQARLQKTWNVPGWGSKEIAHINLLGDILTNGKSSRLYKKLVTQELASEVYYYTSDGEIGGQFNLFVDVNPDVDINRVNAIIDGELADIIHFGIKAEELGRTKANYFVAFLNGLETIGGFGGKSDVLAQSEVMGGSPDAYKKTLGFIENATPADIQNVTSDWLSDGEYNLHILPYPEYSNTESDLDRTKMPPVTAPSLAQFPAVKTFTLSNGMAVYLVEQHDLPLIHVRTAFKGGFSADDAAHLGNAKLMGNMLLEGTTSKSAEQISDQLNALGSQLHSYTAVDYSTLNFETLNNNFDATLGLFADILLHPSFPQKEFDRVKNEQLVAIEQEKANPSVVGQRIYPLLIYPKGHPYHMPATGSGTPVTINALTRADVMSFHQARFVPNNAFMIVIGDMTEEVLKSKLESQLKGWQKKDVPAIRYPDAPILKTPSVYIIDKPGASQSYIYAAELSVPGSDPEMVSIMMMNNILGGTFLSRLNMNLREDKHWSYGAGSALLQRSGQGAFVVRTGVQTDKTKESLVEIKKELTGIVSNDLIERDEFAEEQQAVILGLPDNWQTNEGIAGFLFPGLFYNLGLDYAGKYASAVENLTLTKVQNAAGKVIKPDQLTWLIVGDRSKIEKGIKELNFGPVRFLDGDGKEIK